MIRTRYPRIDRRAVIFLLFSTCGACFAASRDVEADEAGEVVVMTFNIRYDNSGDGPNRWSNRSAAVAKIIEREACDFVGIQEALPNQIADLLKTLPDYRSLGRSREADEKKGEATLILYRHKRWRADARQSGWFWLSDTPEIAGSRSWGNRLPRMAAWGLFHEKSNDRRLYVFNTHFDHASAASREKSAELLRRRIADRDELAPVILCGDFNAGESSEPLAHLLDSTSSPRNRLLDTFRAVHASEKEVSTFHGFQGGTEGEKIDFILASPDLKALSSEILRDPISNSDKPARYPSDHYPVRARLALPSR